MLESIFNWFYAALYGNIFISFSAVFIWGILSVLLSPCHLSSIPLIVGFVNEQGKISIKKAAILSSLFSLGILISIAVIGVTTAFLGRMAGDIGRPGNILISVIFLIVGLHLVGLIPLPFSGGASATAKYKKGGNWAAFIIGLLFGIALGPCTFAYMAPILGLVFQNAATNFFYSAMLLLVYGVGHCSVIILAGTFTEILQKYLHWHEGSKTAGIVKFICGVLVIIAGIYMLYKAL